MGFTLKQAVSEVEETKKKSKVFPVNDDRYRITKVKKKEGKPTKKIST